jgi:hypothetical protein
MLFTLFIRSQFQHNVSEFTTKSTTLKSDSAESAA